MNHKKKLLETTFIIALGKLSTQIISYLLLPLFTSKMAVSEYGTYDLICTISLFVCPMLTLLMEESMFRFLIDSSSKDDRAKIVSQTLIYTGSSILVFIPLTILIMSVGLKATPFMIFSFVSFVVSNVAISSSNSMTRGLGKIKLYSWSNFILGMLNIALTIAMLLARPVAESLLWANTIANLLTSAFVFHRLRVSEYVSKPDIPLMKKMIKYSAPLVPNNISWVIITMSDRIILSSMISEAANGIYAMANRFPNIINVFYGYFHTAWKEQSAQIVKEEDRAKHFNSIYQDTVRILYAITLCLIAAMPFAFPIFIKEAYAESYIYIPIVMIATFYNNVSNYYGGIFTAYKKTKILGTTTMIAAVVNLAINLIFVKVIGIYAACISTLVANLIVYYYRKYKLKKIMKLREVKMLGPMILIIYVLFAYYTKYMGLPVGTYWALNTFGLIISVAYSIAINWNIIKPILNKIKSQTKKVTKKIGK